MVFLTRALCKRDPNTTTFYKYQQILRATGHVIGRAGNERKIARYKVDLDLAKQTRAIRAGIVEQENNKFVECRLKGACDEHRITLPTFLDSLARMSIQLDKVNWVVCVIFSHISHSHRMSIQVHIPCTCTQVHITHIRRNTLCHGSLSVFPLSF